MIFYWIAQMFHCVTWFHQHEFGLNNFFQKQKYHCASGRCMMIFCVSGLKTTQPTTTTHFHAKQCVGKNHLFTIFFWLRVGVHGIQILAYNTGSRFDLIYCVHTIQKIKMAEQNQLRIFLLNDIPPVPEKLFLEVGTPLGW